MDKKSCQKNQTFLTDKVLNTIKKYNLIENGDRLVLGVSGGPDSICMLDVLNRIRNDKNLNLKFDIVVAHINHMIREEAIYDENFVRQFCEKIGIKFYCKSIDVRKIANNNKIGTEEAGRNVRYSFFNEILEVTHSNKIAVAHNKNDNVETIIMNLLRGSGISGLRGIEPLKDNKYIRPLIECERFEIEKYCEDNNIDARIDKTNFENIYTRNKIRNVVIPYIKEEFNPNIIETINRLSNLIKQEDDFMQTLVEQTYSDIILEENKKQIIIDLKKFNNQETVIKSRILLYTITRLMGSTNGIEKIHIQDIIKLCENNIGNKFLTPNKNLKVLIKNSKIYFMSQK